MKRRNFGLQQITRVSAGGAWLPLLGSNPLRVGLIIFPVVGAALLADFDGNTPVGSGVIIPTGGVAMALDYGLLGDSLKQPISFDTSAAGEINLIEIINRDAN